MEKKRGRKLIGDSKRIPASFTIEENILLEFKEYCKKNGISGSSYIQRCIVDLLNENKNQ